MIYVELLALAVFGCAVFAFVAAKVLGERQARRAARAMLCLARRPQLVPYPPSWAAIDLCSKPADHSRRGDHWHVSEEGVTWHGMR